MSLSVKKILYRRTPYYQKLCRHEHFNVLVCVWLYTKIL